MARGKIPLSSVDLSDLERGYVLDALDRRWLSSTGSYVGAFERAVGERIKRTFVTATSSGTSALDLTLRALGVGPGDEVICPALTFAAPASAVVAVGATPVFADVTEESWTIDPDEVRRVTTPRTKATIAVDVLGHPCRYDAFEASEMPIIEDAAEAHGAWYRDRPVGAFGVAAIFSFHANKTISTGEGGCVASDDAALAQRIALLNNHGMTAERPYHHEVVGRNYRMTNLTAAVGLAQVERWDELVAARNRVAAAYDRAFAGVPVLRRPVASWAREGTWLYTIATPERAAVLRACTAAEVDARAIWPALPDQPIFRAGVRGDYPVARRIAAQALWLPTWGGMPEDAIARVVEAVSGGLRRG
jgi:perosamine synthetase